MLAKNPAHFVNGRNMFGGYPEGFEQVLLGMGCFWGAERIFWKLDGVHVTSVGYAGGQHPSPNYEDICGGATGHAEIVHVVFDPKIMSLDEILKVFFENHDPTQGNRQGNDSGPQYRSAVYSYSDAHMRSAQEAVIRYEQAYDRLVTTELREAPSYHPAEDYHQQYLAKNPQGYCGIGPTGIVCHLPEPAKNPA
jgi:peptide-methionine (S)-S-oxide reductase